MAELTATINNEQGIHCRPSAVIVKAVQNYAGEIRVHSGSDTCNPKSIMALLSMGLQRGAEVKISVTGVDEDAVCKQVADLFETQFDFPEQKADEAVAP